MIGSSFTEHIVVPVADEEDARTTGKVLSPYSFGQITVLHVVEKGEGVPDKTPVEQSEQIAETAFGTFRTFFPEVDTEITYRRDVVGAIIDVAADKDKDASAIVFHTRDGSRIIRFLSGDRTLKLVTRSDIPVIAISERNDD